LRRLKGSDYELLNEAQREAVFAPIDRPVLVVAGAGSGKTRVLTLRVAFLVRQLGIPENRILAVTFTNKAAKEMKERLENLINTKNLNVGTFHSFALRIITENLGRFTIYDEEDSKSLLKEICEGTAYKNEVKAIKNAISRYKNTGEVPDWIPKGVFFSILEEYQRRLERSGALDFDDILVKANEILNDEKIRKKYSQKLFYILVDEYQDTNPLQHNILVKIAGDPDHRRVFVVGDEDQAIYSFRGADYRIFLNFRRDFPNPILIKLEKNYRSTQKILDLANNLIRHNVDRRDKVLYSERKEGPDPIYKTFFEDREEAEWIAYEIKLNFKPDDVMILYRANYMSRVLEQALISRGIPYKVVGDVGFFQRKEVKDLLAFLRFSLNRRDVLSLKRALGILEGVGKRTVEKVIDVLIKGGDWRSLNLGKEQRVALEGFFSLIEEISDLKPKHALRRVVEFLNYYQILEKYDPEKYHERKGNVEELFRMAEEYEDPNEFLYQVSLLSSSDEEGSGVSLMTVHSAKGLEREVVFVVGLEEGIFPHSKALEEGKIEEERRLCYVAITRAKTYLYLTSVKNRGNYVDLKPSRFLREMGIIKSENKEGFKRGDRVRHERYGIGVVVDVGLDTIKIMFRNEVKTFVKNKVKIEKL
jgi:DNA helicase-2/ATP-dependent DNA helicase PcrA